MRFKSDSQRKAVFAQMNRFSSSEDRKFDFKLANIIKFKSKPKEEVVIEVKDTKDWDAKAKKLVDEFDESKFSDREYEYDYKNVALKKYGKEMQDVPVIKSGRDRNVYLLNEENVLKVAKSPEGLMQNTCEGDCYFNIVPDVSEKGSDYAVVERADRDDPRTRKFLKPIQGYHQTQVELHPSNLQNDLLKIDEEYGTDVYNILNYDVAWNDFTAPRNWGWKEDMPKLTDAGALSTHAIKKLEKGDPTRTEWRMILDERRKTRKELGLDNKFSDLDDLTYVKKRNRDNYALVNVDLDKFDTNWKKDEGYYVGPGGEGGIGSRYENVKEYLTTTKEPVEAPEVTRMKAIDVVSFTDGRHRAAVLRDLGAKKMTILVPKEDKGWFEDNFGV